MCPPDPPEKAGRSVDGCRRSTSACRRDRGLMILAPKLIWAHLPGPDTFYIVLVVLLIAAAPVWIGAGMRLQQTSPSVMILDTGEGKLLFRFKSQMYRNYFAELNGEDFRRARENVRPI
jgi:hypothetical protein